MVITLRRALFLIAAVVFLIALVITLGAWTGQNATAWMLGGFIAVALGLAAPVVAGDAVP